MMKYFLIIIGTSLFAFTSIGVPSVDLLWYIVLIGLFFYYKKRRDKIFVAGNFFLLLLFVLLTPYFLDPFINITKKNGLIIVTNIEKFKSENGEYPKKLSQVIENNADDNLDISRFNYYKNKSSDSYLLRFSQFGRVYIYNQSEKKWIIFKK